MRKACSTVLGLSVGFALATAVTVSDTSVWITSVNAEEATPVFQPQVSGAPSRRIGGGVRSLNVPGGGAAPALVVLAPETTGYTSNPHPTLYWSISSLAQVKDKPVKFTLVYDDMKMSGKPVVEATISKPTEGIQGINLAEHNVNLKPEVEYKWSVSIIVDPQQRSGDLIAEGTLKMPSPDKLKELEAKLAKASEKEKPFIYAKAGYWYDAISDLSVLVNKYPSDDTFRRQRAALLQQVGFHSEKTGSKEIVTLASKKAS